VVPANFEYIHATGTHTHIAEGPASSPSYSLQDIDDMLSSKVMPELPDRRGLVNSLGMPA